MREVTNNKGLPPKEQISKYIKVNVSNRNYQAYHNIIWHTTALTGVPKCGRINNNNSSCAYHVYIKERKENQINKPCRTTQFTVDIGQSPTT